MNTGLINFHSFIRSFIFIAFIFIGSYPEYKITTGVEILVLYFKYVKYMYTMYLILKSYRSSRLLVNFINLLKCAAFIYTHTPDIRKQPQTSLESF